MSRVRSPQTSAGSACRALAFALLALGATGCPGEELGDGGAPSDGGGTLDGGATDDGGPGGDSGVAMDAGANGGLSIYDLQDESRPQHPYQGSSVALEGVIVTGVDNTTNERGFFIEEPAGGAFSGIFVYKPVQLDVDLDALAVGDVVDVAGEYTEYNGLSEIHLASLEVTGSTEVPAPVLDPDLVESAEAYEGVLIELCGGCEVERLLAHDEVETSCALLDDQLYDYTLDASMTFTCIRGIWTFTFGDYKLLPRGPDDFTCDARPCFPEPEPADAGVDAGSEDAGGGTADAGTDDGGMADAGQDAGAADAGGDDAGNVDAGAVDAGGDDAGAADAGGDDAGTVDAGTASDAGAGDAGASNDAGPV